MLTRYRMYRGARPADDPLPSGIRLDTRKHTKHCLRPTSDAVRDYLAAPNDEAWEQFAAAYRATLAERLESDPTPFDDLAAKARTNDVHLGCSCPTAKNPDVRQCHTWLALAFMQERYPAIEVVFPGGG